jgi:hypothetical protein
VRFCNQAQFHPLKFIAAIAKGLRIYENTFVREMIGNTAVTDQAKIHAKKVIVSTHFPFLNKHGSYFLKLYQHRSYVVSLENASDLQGMYVDDENTGLADDRYWGIMGSNFSRNLHHENIYINRFDAHAGFWNGSIVNSTIGSHINIIGGGTFLLDRVTRIGNSANFMDMRLDYGSSFDGDIIMKDCVFEAKYGYNTMRGTSYNKNARETAYIFWTAWASPAEDYLTWDFGYTCSLPENITIDNFKCMAGEYYIFQDIPDSSFDTYQITKSITIKNMDRIDVCKSPNCKRLLSIPITYIYKET